jgi:hypothetical protein
MNLRVIRDGESDTTLGLFGGEAWFRINGYVNNRFPMLIQEMPRHDVKVGLWCVGNYE